MDGPPALCVLSACLGGFGEHPDVVVSGINAGANTGHAVLHSGTVGAAFIANNFGLRAIAVSQPVGEEQHWATAADVATGLIPWIVAAGEVVTLDANVPNEPIGQMPAALAALDRGGEVQTAMFESAEGTLRLRPSPRGPAEGSDTALLAAGAVSITALHAVQHADVSATVAVDLVERTLARAAGGARVA